MFGVLHAPLDPFAHPACPAHPRPLLPLLAPRLPHLLRCTPLSLRSTHAPLAPLRSAHTHTPLDPFAPPSFAPLRPRHSLRLPSTPTTSPSVRAPADGQRAFPCTQTCRPVPSGCCAACSTPSTAAKRAPSTWPTCCTLRSVPGTTPPRGTGTACAAPLARRPPPRRPPPRHHCRRRRRRRRRRPRRSRQ